MDPLTIGLMMLPQIMGGIGNFMGSRELSKFDFDPEEVNRNPAFRRASADAVRGVLAQLGARGLAGSSGALTKASQTVMDRVYPQYYQMLYNQELARAQAKASKWGALGQLGQAGGMVGQMMFMQPYLNALFGSGTPQTATPNAGNTGPYDVYSPKNMYRTYGYETA